LVLRVLSDPKDLPVLRGLLVQPELRGLRDLPVLPDMTELPVLKVLPGLLGLQVLPVLILPLPVLRVLQAPLVMRSRMF